MAPRKAARVIAGLARAADFGPHVINGAQGGLADAPPQGTTTITVTGHRALIIHDEICRNAGNFLIRFGPEPWPVGGKGATGATCLARGATISLLVGHAITHAFAMQGVAQPLLGWAASYT